MYTIVLLNLLNRADKKSESINYYYGNTSVSKLCEKKFWFFVKFFVHVNHQ